MAIGRLFTWRACDARGGADIVVVSVERIRMFDDPLEVGLALRGRPAANEPEENSLQNHGTLQVTWQTGRPVAATLRAATRRVEIRAPR